MATDVNGFDCRISAKVELITPEEAERLLSSMGKNRNLNKQRVQAYCDDRRQGRWMLTHQGIGIDEYGRLIDGQHRLQMVVLTGMPTWFLVIRGIPCKAILHIDDQLPRSIQAAGQFAGEIIQREAITIARGFLSFPFSESTTQRVGSFLSRGKILEILKMYDDGIQFSCHNVARMHGLSRSVRVLVARAFYHIDHGRLKEFCQILENGMPVSVDATEDAAAITFRNFAIRSINTGGGGANEVEKYKKAQASLRNFIDRLPLSKIYACEEDLFPVVTPIEVSK